MKLRDQIYIFVIFLTFIFIRSLHFNEIVNISADQGIFSLRALEIWRNKEITLVGPTASFSYQGRFLMQSSVIFYTTLFFLLLGNFDLVSASWAVVLVASLMCWPLYRGTQLLFNRPAAILITAAYALLPFFVDYTRFLWNPNFQLMLIPLGIYGLGKWKQSLQARWLFFSGFSLGVAFLFHHQLILLLVALTLYFLWRKRPLKDLAVWVGGLLLGYSPFILFEINSGFYMTQTIQLLWQHRAEVFAGEKSTMPPHYVLSLAFSLLIALIGVVATRLTLVTERKAVLVAGALFIFSLVNYWPVPSHAFGMVDNWNYVLEGKAAEIIRTENLDNFAVVNTLYETTASIQYYLLTRDRVTGATTDYRNNRYLFVIGPAGKENFLDNAAYELNTFVPFALRNQWPLSDFMTLYLFERLPIQ